MRERRTPFRDGQDGQEAATDLDAFETERGEKYRAVVRLCRCNWDNIIPFFPFLPHIQRVIYTTNAIESMLLEIRITDPLTALSGARTAYATPSIFRKASILIVVCKCRLRNDPCIGGVDD